MGVSAQPPHPAGTNLRCLVGKPGGSIFPLGLSVAQICSAGEPEAPVPIPLSLIQISGLFMKTQKPQRFNAALIYFLRGCRT